MRPAEQQPDEWNEIVRLARAYCRRKYGWTPLAVTFHAPYGDLHHREPMTIAEQQQAGVGSAFVPARLHDWASGPVPQHLSDFRAVYWPGLGKFVLSTIQAAVVRQLWEAMEDGTWEIQQSVLLQRGGSDSSRLVDVFKNSPAWRTLIVLGDVAGSYRLPRLPDPDEDEIGAD